MSAPGVLNAVSKYAIPVFLAVSLGQAAIYDVRGGTRAVIFDRLAGVKEDVVNEGTHFLVPWLQKAIIYDVRTKPRNISTTTGSKDLQMVSLTLRVLHRPEVQRLPKIYQVSFHDTCNGCVSGWCCTRVLHHHSAVYTTLLHVTDPYSRNHPTNTHFSFLVTRPRLR